MMSTVYPLVVKNNKGGGGGGLIDFLPLQKGSLREGDYLRGRSLKEDLR